MIQKEEGIPAENVPGINLNKSSLLTMIVCVGMSMFFLRAGFLSFFFLAPLGYAVIVTGSFFMIFFASASTNIILGLTLIASSSESVPGFWIYNVYLTILFLAFTWLIGSTNIRTLYRLIIAAAAGSLALLYEFLRADSLLYKVFTDIAIEVSESFSSSNAMFESESLIEYLKNFMLKGGAFAGLFFLFILNRKMAFSAVFIFKKQKIDKSLTAFFAPPNAIWILFGSLVTVLLTNFFNIELLNILAWNVFVVCGIIFLAQGAAILMYWQRMRSIGFRIAVNIMIVLILLSPFSTFAIGALVLLGVVENWRPFRLSKSV